MKLKKIASLALAGIMAVSMLAGCKDGGNGNNGGQDNGGDIPPLALTQLLFWRILQTQIVL